MSIIKNLGLVGLVLTGALAVNGCGNPDEKLINGRYVEFHNTPHPDSTNSPTSSVHPTSNPKNYHTVSYDFYSADPMEKKKIILMQVVDDEELAKLRNLETFNQVVNLKIINGEEKKK